MNYREHAPSEALRRYVTCYWTLRSSDEPAINRVLPDGCADLLFDLGDDHLPASTAPAQLIGPMTRALAFTLPRRVDVLGVRFRPGGASAFLATGLSPLRDRSPPLDDLWARRGASLLAEALAETPTTEGRLALVERELHTRLANARAPHPKVRAAVEAMRRDAAGARVAGLSAELGLGERQLQRLFLEHVGVNPAFFRRVMRLQALVSSLPGAGEQGFARLALDLGYADQAHLARDVRALSGLSPTALGREMAGFYNPDPAAWPTVGPTKETEGPTDGRSARHGWHHQLRPGALAPLLSPARPRHTRPRARLALRRGHHPERLPHLVERRFDGARDRPRMDRALGRRAHVARLQVRRPRRRRRRLRAHDAGGLQEPRPALGRLLGPALRHRRRP